MLSISQQLRKNWNTQKARLKTKIHSGESQGYLWQSTITWEMSRKEMNQNHQSLKGENLPFSYRNAP